MSKNETGRGGPRVLSRHMALPYPARQGLHLAKRLHFLSRHGPGLWRQAGKKDPAASAGERLRQLFAGFDPLEASWYLQARGHVDGCVSNLHREEYLKGVNGQFGHVLDNKHLFALVAEQLGIAHPRLFGFTRAGRWRWQDGGLEALELEFAQGGRAILKPNLGKKGSDVRIVRDMEGVRSNSPGEMIVTAFVQQADYAASINAGSLNTIRLLTIRPGPDQDAFVAAAVHRFGGTPPARSTISAPVGWWRKWISKAAC